MTTPRPLQLRRCASAQREVAAWFLAGGEPSAWLAELCRWQVPLETLRCYVAPRGAGDIPAGGLLVIPPAGGVRPPDVRGLAFGMVGGKLLVPVEAEFTPPVTADEIAALCLGAVALFHPAIGVVEFEAEDACGVWSFLAPAQFTEANWNMARAGAILDSRLVGVALPALPAMGEIFGEAGREIGSEPLRELPPRPQEPSAGAGGRVGRKLRKWGAEAVMKMLSRVPSSGSKRTWVNQVLDWASAKLGSVSREIEDLRQLELLRLMHLLESDPDRGLRHALPLGGAPGRGRQAPGARLGTRAVDFNLGHIGGGGPVDPWNVPPDLRKKLAARYRELALHEQQLGRFKRAAYIHAELLGDLNAAAAVLKEGRLFAEAAVLYRDHLRQPLVAAECFLEAALFAEAIAIYEKEGKWLELGDLHERLGNRESAEAAWRRAVERLVAAGVFVEAADLLEHRLRSPEEALALLRNGWPNAPQAALCLQAEFALLGRLGRPPAALQRLAGLRVEKTPSLMLLPLAEILGSIGATYPDSLVRESARDLARVKISGLLARGEGLPALRAATQLVARLAPADRLLARDASRFLAARTDLLHARRSPNPPPRPRQPGSRRIGAPVVSSILPLPAGLIWIAVRRLGSCFFAIVRNREGISFLRGNWRGETERIVANLAWRNEVLQLGADEAVSDPDYVLTSRVSYDQSPPRAIAATDSFPKRLRVGPPLWASAEILVMSVSGAQWWALRLSGADLILEERTEDGRLVGSFDVLTVLDGIGPARATFSLLALRLHVWIACGVNLLLFKGGRVERRWRLESPILGLEASAPFLACAVVARCERGVAVFWHDALAVEVEMIGSEIENPHAVFLGHGALILAGGVNDGRGLPGLAVDLDRRGIHSEQKFYQQGSPPKRLISTDRPDEFAIFDGTAEARIMRLPTEL